MANKWTEQGEVWSGRDLAEGERVTVSVFDKATQVALEQTTFTPRAGRLDQFTWVMDLCEQVNAQLKLIRAGVQAGDKLEIKSSGYLNKYWGITERDVQVITTTARANNWTNDKRVHIDLTEAVQPGATLLLKVHNTKGALLETVSFKPATGRNTPGFCSKDFALAINQASLYVRAGFNNGIDITPYAQSLQNWIWIPYNADFTVSWSIDLSSLKALGEVWSGRDLAEGERVTVSVFDKARQTVLEQTTFVPKAGRLDQYTWVMDLCGQVNAQLKLIGAGVKAGDKLEIKNSGYLNMFWNLTERDVQVITTTARANNWTNDKRVHIDLAEAVQPGATLQLKVHNAKGALLETVSFKPTPGRNTPGFCSKDFALAINQTSLYVRAGFNNGIEIKPYAQSLQNWIWIPYNANFKVSWSVVSEHDEGWSIDLEDTEPESLPGMSSEAKQLFDKYAEHKFITVDTKSGLPTLSIPVADLFADDSFSHPLKVGLAFNAAQGLHIQLGAGERRVALDTGKEPIEYILTLRDGRPVRVDSTLNFLNGGDFKVQPYWSKTMVGGIAGQNRTGVSIIYKDGVVENFAFQKVDLSSAKIKVVLVEYILPSGDKIELAYDRGILSEITRNKKPLMKVEWVGSIDTVTYSDEGVQFGDLRMDTIVVYPDGAGDKVTWKFFEKEKNHKTIDFCADGFSANSVIFYYLTADQDGRLNRLDIQHKHALDVDKKDRGDFQSACFHEELKYTDDGKVDQHVISLDLDDLIHEYTYDSDTTRLTGYFETMEPRTAFVRTYRFTDGQEFTEEYGSETVPIKKTNAHVIDMDKKVLVSETTIWEGDIVVEKQSLTLDAVGNPVSRSEGDTITYWTYYNNYQQFRVTETETKMQDWSLFGVLFKPVDYANPIGWGFLIGGSGGLSWGTRISTTVEMLPASNDYAKDAFNLPVAISHSGSDRPFSCDVESELVCRRIDGKDVAQRLSFFGYAEVNGQIRTKHKLTILRPDYTRVDVVDKQLAVATAAAKSFIESLNKQIKQASGDEKKSYQQALDDLNVSLKAQSKVNGEGFKLGAWKAGSMSLDTFEYHTDADKPGFGTLKLLETVLLDDKGKAIEASRRTTRYDYSVDAGDSNRLTIKTTVSRSGETSIVSSQTRSRNTGRLLESIDTEGVKTVRTYEPQGHLKSETVSKGETTLRQTTITLESGPRYRYTQVEDGVFTSMTRDLMGRKGTLYLMSGTQELELQNWLYDLCGRIESTRENDYGKDDKLLAQRQTTFSYDELSGQITQTHVLSANGETSTTVQTRTPSLGGERFVQGDFSVERTFTDDTRLLTESYLGKDKAGCRIERQFSAEGLLKSVRYLTVDGAGKASEHDRTDFTYDGHGQLSSATPKLGAASSYSYDSAGRLLSTTRDGVVLSNTYGTSSLAAVAGKSEVKRGDQQLTLGEQTVDMLGRATSLSVNQNTTGFSYSGASNRATFTTPGKAPSAVAGYSSTVDKATRIHTQTLDGKSSTLVFTTGGRVETFTDLTGTVTTYEYDFFNRLVGSSNDQCVCTFTYSDNGLLASESIKAVKAGDLMMKVSYGYDQLGQEISRSFTCEGVETLTLERTLLADGRLSKSALKSAKTVGGKVINKQVHSDSYEYDKALRLSQWIARGEDEGEGTIVKASAFSEWKYDGLGNITSALGVPDIRYRRVFFSDEYNAGQFTNVALLDANKPIPDKVNSGGVTYDSSGRLTASEGRSITYHDNGQVKVYDLYTFSYDSEGRVRGGSKLTQTEAYHYRGDSVYAVVKSDTDRNAWCKELVLTLRNESRACLMQDANTDGTISRSFELRDANGTVFASIDLADKTITYFRYEPYGKRFSGEKATTWLGFKGEPLNRFGLYHLGNGYRLYDPEWGCFLSRDSRSPFGVGGAAGYVFCDGDPVNNADPSGHQVIAQYERWGSAPIIYSTAFRVTVGAIGVLIAPFTAGMSVMLAVATTALAVATTALAVATTALAAISFAFDMASLIIAESDPQLSKTLEAWGQVFGLATAAAGIAMTVHGIKGLPRNIYRTRGGPSVPTPVKWPRTPNELRLAQQARSKALTQLIQSAEEAKAAGTFEAFKAMHFNAEAGMASGFVPAMPASSRFIQRAGNAGKDLFKGIIRQVEDSRFDYLGTTLDLHSGANMLVQKFIAAPLSETEIISIVAAAMPGREKLFP